jgi:hypothetical protein
MARCGGERDTSAFRLGLQDSGYAASRTVPIPIRHDRPASLADDLIRTPVAMIVAAGDVALVAKAATTSIPIVFYTERDPIKTQFAASRSHYIQAIEGRGRDVQTSPALPPVPPPVDPK